MVNKVFVVAGGRGTRSVNPKIPKVLQEIHSGLKLVDFHLENLYRSKLWHITFLLNYGFEEIRESLANRESTYRNFSFRFRHDKPDESLSQVVSNAIREDTEEGDLIVVTLGDVLQNINYQKHLSHLRGTDYLGTVLVHPNLHPHESDVFEVGWHQSPPKLRLKGHERSELNPTKQSAASTFCDRNLWNFSPETQERSPEIFWLHYIKPENYPLLIQLSIFRILVLSFAFKKLKRQSHLVSIEDEDPGSLVLYFLIEMELSFLTSVLVG